MKYSIIIPTYNCEKYIRECVMSIINNDYEDYELIIVNDGSTDNTFSILNELSKDCRIKVFKIENSGVSFSRNYGLQKAKGKFIMFVDSDDLLENDWHDKLEDIVSSDTDFIFFNKNFYVSYTSDEPLINIMLQNKKENKFLSTPWSKVYKKEIIDNYNIKFNSAIINGEDLIFNAQYFSHTKNYKVIKDSIYKYRIVANSLTNNYNYKIWQSDYNYSIELEKILKQNNIKKYQNIINYEKYNGLFLIIVRIIKNNNFKRALQILKNEIIFNEEFYNYQYNFKEFDLNKKIILKLFKQKRFKIIIILIKLKINLMKKNNREKVITI